MRRVLAFSFLVCTMITYAQAPPPSGNTPPNQINPSNGIKWPQPDCHTGVYVPSTNTCVPSGTAANPGGAAGDVQQNVGGTFGKATSNGIINSLGYTPLNKAGDTMTGHFESPTTNYEQVALTTSIDPNTLIQQACATPHPNVRLPAGKYVTNGIPLTSACSMLHIRCDTTAFSGANQNPPIPLNGTVIQLSPTATNPALYNANENASSGSVAQNTISDLWIEGCVWDVTQNQNQPAMRLKGIKHSRFSGGGIVSNNNPVPALVGDGSNFPFLNGNYYNRFENFKLYDLSPTSTALGVYLTGAMEAIGGAGSNEWSFAGGGAYRYGTAAKIDCANGVTFDTFSIEGSRVHGIWGTLSPTNSFGTCSGSGNTFIRDRMENSNAPSLIGFLFDAGSVSNVVIQPGLSGNFNWWQDGPPPAPITQIAIDGSNNLTVTASNTLLPNLTVNFSGLTSATFLNGQNCAITSATSTSFTCAYTHAAYTAAPDTGSAAMLPMNICIGSCLAKVGATNTYGSWYGRTTPTGGPYNVGFGMLPLSVAGTFPSIGIPTANLDIMGNVRLNNSAYQYIGQNFGLVNNLVTIWSNNVLFKSDSSTILAVLSPNGQWGWGYNTGSGGHYQSTGVPTAGRTVSFGDGNSSTVFGATLVSTAATTDIVPLQGTLSTSKCTISPTNAAAAAAQVTTPAYISNKNVFNQLTVTHAATAGMNYDITCTPN